MKFNWTLAIAFVVVMLIIKRFFIYKQVKHYSEMILEMKKKGNVGSGVVKGNFSGRVIILCSSPEREIIDAYLLKGFSNFSRFQQVPELIGKSLDQAAEEKFEDKKFSKAVKMAVEQINNIGKN